MKAVDAILDEKSQSAHFGDDDGRAHGHRFQRDHAEAFVMGWHDDHFGGGKMVGQDVLVLGAQECDQVVQAQFPTHLLQPGHFRILAGRPGIAADKGHADVLQRFRALFLDEGHRSQKGVDPFERFDATGEDDVLMVSGDTDSFFGRFVSEWDESVPGRRREGSWPLCVMSAP